MSKLSIFVVCLGMIPGFGFQVPGDLALTPDGSDFIFVRSNAGLVQTIQVSLQIFRGSWEYDENAGVPYLSGAFAKNSGGLARAIVSDHLVKIPGVGSVENVSTSLDKKTRKLRLDWQVTTNQGELVTGRTFFEVP